MSVLSDSDRKKLKKNPNVLKVTEKYVTYTPEFRTLAVEKHFAGESYKKIFIDAGIDLSPFDSDYARKCLERWIEIFSKSGATGFRTENRGRASKGRPKGRKFKSLEAENAYLRAENDFLKKLNALEADYLKKKNSR